MRLISHFQLLYAPVLLFMASTSNLGNQVSPTRCGTAH
jgi:hypothetical protein